MLMEMREIFGLEKPIIGAIHFSPLIGYKEFKGLNFVLKNALLDLKSLEKGGVNGIIIENNYDFPHKIFVDPKTVAAMTSLGIEIKKHTKLPLGVSVLWNDYKASLFIAKAVGGSFIRVSTFVDDIETDFGEIHPNPKEIIDYRKFLQAENIAIFADVQVKHARMLNERPIEESAVEAEKMGADGLIVTGKVTGNPPSLERIISCKNSVKIPILIGSGLDNKNAPNLLKYSDGAIVGTYFKTGEIVKGERNAKSYSARIDESKVEKFMKAIK